MSFIAGYTAGTNAKLKRDELAKKAKLQREELAILKAEQALKLQEAGYTLTDNNSLDIVPGGAADVKQQERDNQMQELSMQREAVRSLQSVYAANATDAAIADFTEFGDANVFQKAFNNNPILKQIWAQRGVHQITNIDFENDVKLLENAGITQKQIENPEFRDTLKKNAWKYWDGKNWNIGLLEQLVVETGSLRRINTKQNNMIIEGIGRFRNALKGTNVALEEQQAQTDQNQVDVNKQQANTAQQRATLDKNKAEQDYALKLAELDYKNRKLKQDLKTGRGSTARIKNTQKAMQLQDEMINEAGGPEAFLSLDWTDPQNLIKHFNNIEQIEILSGNELSEADKKNLFNIRQLIALADPAKKLTQADTGLLDNFLGNVRTYLTNEVKGVKAKSAYTAFRNVVRHSLYGSVLTKVEIQSYNQAFGNLGQKLGPVLQRFSNNLIQLKAQLDSIIRNGNPYTMTARLGADTARLNKIIEAVDANLNLISGKSVNNPEIYESLSNTKKPTLDELFNKSSRE